MGPGIWLLGGRQDRLSLFGRVGSLISRRYNGPFVLTFPCQAWEVLAKGLFLFCRNYTKKGRKLSWNFFVWEEGTMKKFVLFTAMVFFTIPVLLGTPSKEV